jgi:hypothetical protein
VVEQATASGDYRRVAHAELLPFLAQRDGLADLIVAADAFICVSALEAVVTAAARRLSPGGVLAFSVEQADPGHDLQLRPSLRCAHGRTAIEQLAASCGLVVRALWAAAIREDQGQPVMGWCMLLQHAEVKTANAWVFAGGYSSAAAPWSGSGIIPNMAPIHHMLSTASSTRLTGWTTGLLMVVSLAACGQLPAAALRCDTVAPAGTAQRVLVSFREATAADAPAVIEKLQTLAGACVRPVSSVSPKLHVYAVNTTVDVVEVRARLLRWTAVTAVEADVVVQRH